ncbi:MAG: hypothetical protein ACR2P0_21015 [Acidimicrobiales bacterium]
MRGHAERAEFEANLREQLESIYSAHRWVSVSEVIQGAVGGAGLLKGAGATETIAVSATGGVGDVDESVEAHSIGLTPSGSHMDNMRRGTAALLDPPQGILDAVDRFDPDGRARTFVDFTFGQGVYAGRPTFGARPPEWEEFEDKLLIEEVWQSAGIRTSPSEVVALSQPGAAVDAHERLGSAEGTVWAVDNDDGWHGGAHGTHWIRSIAEAEEAAANLTELHRRVRIMPFVEGTPCSIHGMVVGDRTIAFRPMELMIYRNRAQAKLVYGKAASFWDPPVDDRNEMRAAACAIGDELRRRVEYRGVFTVDGVLGAEGFVPTEVNTRFGGALPSGIGSLDGPPIHLFLIHTAIVEGVLAVDPIALEQWVLADLDEHRRCYGMLQTANGPEAEKSARVFVEASGAFTFDEAEQDNSEPTDDDLEPLAHLTWGARGEEGLFFLRGTDKVPTGPPSAPLVLQIAQLADDVWNIGLESLEPARPV